MSNDFVAAQKFIQQLVNIGVREFCLAAGSRNSPLVAAVASSPDLRAHFFFEERSAAFFALGRIQDSGRPVAVVTTSGTAAAELFAAVIEAHYAGWPLIAVTADRPESYRQSGAPQAIEQKNLFGVYPEIFWEGRPEEFSMDVLNAENQSWSLCRPLHLNVFIDEPLLPSEVPPISRYTLEETFSKNSTHEPLTQSQARQALVQALSQATKPLVLLSALPRESRSWVEAFCAQLQVPIWAEALSCLRESAALKALVLRSSERLLSQENLDLILRFGGVPTTSFWRDLDTKKADPQLKRPQVLSFDHKNFSGLPGATHFKVKLGSWLLECVSAFRGQNYTELFKRDLKLFDLKRELFLKYPKSEPALIEQLSRRIPIGSRIFLGNSMPIREWDLAADPKNRSFEIFANRGANGIDGETSTFFGLCSDSKLSEAESDQENVAILGDLTTLYDLAAPWILRQLDDPSFQIVVINNGGGRIFARLPALRALKEEVRREALELEHQISFESWARLWNLGYEQWSDGLASQWPAARQGIIELIPDEHQTQNFWAAFAKLWS